MSSTKERIHWVDTLKGFGIVLVVYGHNFPFLETYIYTFHMPLFFFLAGLFHPKSVSVLTVKKRAKQLLIPYFLWSILLFLVWFFVGRNYGDSVDLNLSVTKNLIGVFYAQGGHEFMNWGLQMWFLPAIFLTFICFGAVRKVKKLIHQILLLILLISIGFVIPRVLDFHLIWGFDVALVSLFFYALAFYLKDILLKQKVPFQNFFLLLFLVMHIMLSLSASSKVDMYRSIYGNEFLFLANGLVGVGFWLMLFKKCKNINFLSFLGKNTLPVLALHIRSLTFIKFLLILFFGVQSFSFSELEKIILVFFQLLILYPVILIINKKLPILNGKIKTLENRA